MSKTPKPVKATRAAKPVEKPITHKGVKATAAMQGYITLKPDFAARLTFKEPLDYYVEAKKAGTLIEVPASVNLTGFIKEGVLALAPADENEVLEVSDKQEPRVEVGEESETFAGKIDLENDPFADAAGEKESQ